MRESSPPSSVDFQDLIPSYFANKNKILAIQDRAEQNLQIALWVCELIKYYIKKEKPQTPQALKDFKFTNPKNQIKMIEDGFFLQDEIQHYLNESGQVEAENSSNIHHLRWCYDILSEANRQERFIVEKKLREFGVELIGAIKQKDISEPEKIEWEE